MRGFNVHVEPGKIYTWEEFKSNKPSFSIALDGLVNEPTRRDISGPYANYDHHSKVDRTATRSTSDQVHLEINLGLFETFKKDGRPYVNIYVNDCDEDTCLAIWLLQHPDLVRNHSLPNVNRLVYCEDRLDTTAGSYPFGDISIRRKMAWIFEPYNKARFDGKLSQLNDSLMQSVIEAVNARIDNYVFNGVEELALEGHYERIGGGPGWSLVKETGPASRMALYNDGISAFVALVGSNGDNYRYVLGRKSGWINFDIQRLYSIFNNIEKEIVRDNNLWGGSDTIGGSPRGTGSHLPPEELQRIINDSLFGI